MLSGSVLLGSLRRRVCLARPFTKPWARDLLHDAKEVVAQRDRHLNIPVLRGDRLGRLRLVLVVGHHSEASP